MTTRTATRSRTTSRAARLPRGHRRGDRAARHRQAGADARARHRARAGRRRPAGPARGRGWPRPRVRRAGRRVVALPARVPTAPRQRAAGDGLPGRARRRRRRDRPRARPARGVGDGTLTSDRRVPAARGHRGDPGRVLAEPGTPAGRGLARPGRGRQPRDRTTPPRRAGGGHRRRRAAGEQLHPRPRRAPRLGPDAGRAAALSGSALRPPCQRRRAPIRSMNSSAIASCRTSFSRRSDASS